MCYREKKRNLHFQKRNKNKNGQNKNGQNKNGQKSFDTFGDKNAFLEKKRKIRK